ncbi:MAG: hypothetical protein Q8O55_13210 [Dehalococcoidales bacterium]|nr:hypothetical protein [Dehalococcoidales bacterium]
MKRYLIPIIILVLTLGTLVGCGFIRVTPEKQSVTELKSYIDDALPIMKRHAETTETTNQANRAFLRAFAAGNQKEIVKALTAYRDTLEWAVNRVDSTLLDFKKLVPPSEVRTYHSLMIEALTKEQYGLTKQLSYYSSVLRYGFGDDKELDDGNELLLEAQKVWLQAQYEFSDLLEKAGK